MNPILQVVLNTLLKYLKDNPDQVELLVKSLLDFIVSEITKNQIKDDNK